MRLTTTASAMPDEKLEKLIRKRASYKGQLTTFSTHITSITASSLEPSEVNELQLRINRMELMYDKYDEVQLSLECNADDLSSQMSERNEFESLYYKILSQAKKLLEECKKEEAESEIGSRRSCSHNPIKLPTIQLPKFNGSYDNWMEFHDTFSSLIHRNDDIDDINKFHYLRSSLQEAATVVIQSLEFSSKNYNIAWQLLCDRYDNKRLLIQNHVAALFNLDVVTKESAISLKRLIDQTNKNLRSLESLGEPTTYWDTLLIYIIGNKLDSKSYREWEEFKGSLAKDQKMSFDIFVTFLRNRADLLETIEMSQNKKSSNQSVKSSSNFKAMLSVSDNSNNKNKLLPKSCPNCSSDHSLINCPQFLALNNESRLKLLPEYKVCYNCLNSGHYANRCKKQGCKICRRKHNSLVHVSDYNKPVSTTTALSTDSLACNSIAHTPPPSQGAHAQPHTTAANMSLSVSVSAPPQTDNGDVLLSTALIKINCKNNRSHIVRALLDSGSTSCLMSEGLYEKLELPYKLVNNSVLGINNVKSNIDKICSFKIKSLDESFSTNINCFVLPAITNNVPTKQVDMSNLRLPSNICLADPHFHAPAPVDLLIGADVFWDILGSQRIKLGDGQPILCDTKLGWLVSGPIQGGHVSSSQLKCNFLNVSDTQVFHNDDDLQSQLSRFWKLEEVSVGSQYSSEEKACEEHFVRNTTRLNDGRFCVRVPLKHTPNLLGDSLPRAKQCFLSLERRLNKQPTLRKMYKEFMSEYESLGHMAKIQPSEMHSSAHYIPHHGVLRESSTTTKLRVVFNASSPTTTSVSYNQLQMVGPVVQDDLLSILLRFRQHKYVLVSDIEKMYRQIQIHSNDQYLQQVVWRSDSSYPLRVYRLKTVTYGTASAPFLATRCLKQLGLECTDKQVADAIIHDLYVDDWLSGGDDINEVIRLREKVTSTLASAQMHLRKWKSNEPQVLPKPELTHSSLDLNIGDSEPSKTLGLGWVPQSDLLCFPIGDSITGGKTKRAILSTIAQIFDPLGLLAPYVVVMKILLQILWLHKISWDDTLPQEIHKSWVEILANLPLLKNIKIPRRVLCDSPQYIELHIFTDASERAYGSCVYVRSVDNNGDVLVRLLIAKSRVATIKPMTIPRLELCGALTGSRLYEKTIASLRKYITRAVFWTDSTIVLGWLRTMPSKLQPFVRNRVADILEKTGDSQWRHVPTEDNPADYVSRGVEITALPTLEQWWSGPAFLKKDISCWPTKTFSVNIDTLPELKPNVCLHGQVTELVQSNKDPFIQFERFSNFLRLKRAVAFMLRFVNLCRNQRISGHLRNEELQVALSLIIRTSQAVSFPEYHLLIQNKELPKKSQLLKFSVFLDDQKIIRVGGRLKNSDFDYNKKYPILLQSTHRFTKLLLAYEHKRLMHAGPQLLLAAVRENYWPIGGRSLARYTYRQCVTCCRMKGQTIAPIMGNLPSQRLAAGFPFETVALDYAGPILSASRQGRGCKLVKVYIAILVCFTTKSIHLELVGDLTSKTFLMALRRFISRRGKPKHIYTDNGTSFTGAYNELSKFLKSSCDSISSEVDNEGINFHFIPAYSPHFAGLAEAGVKSTKYHLVRVLGNCHLTYEELNTTLVQIEAILNSRPLMPLSSDPDDMMPLTPGHFIIGRPLTSLPSPDYQDDATPSLTRFQRIEQLRQHFWTRWSKEYISELQLRCKWRSSKGASLKLNQLVLLKEDNLPPLKWKLGRIIAVHPGSDGIVRVADVKTSSSVLRRSFSKICPLPDEDNVLC